MKLRALTARICDVDFIEDKSVFELKFKSELQKIKIEEILLKYAVKNKETC